MLVPINGGNQYVDATKVLYVDKDPASTNARIYLVGTNFQTFGFLFASEGKDAVVAALNAARVGVDIALTGDIASTVSLSTPS